MNREISSTIFRLCPGIAQLLRLDDLARILLRHAVEVGHFSNTVICSADLEFEGTKGTDMTMIPHTPTERLILLEEIERGDKIVIPTSIEHAKFMIQVAQFYIDQQHQATFKALAKDYTK